MSLDTDHLELSTIPDCYRSANHYASYLWLGHQIFQPRDFWNDELSFTEDRGSADAAFERFQARIEEEGPEVMLLRQMKTVVKRARTEIATDRPLTPEQQRFRLRVYLVGEVSVWGMRYAEACHLTQADPDLAKVTSPFTDGELIEKVIRSRGPNRITNDLRHYATINKLLPGYPPAMAEK